MFKIILTFSCLLSLSFSSYASTKTCAIKQEKKCNLNPQCEWKVESKKCADKKTTSEPNSASSSDPDVKAEDILKDTPIDEPEEAPGN